MRLGLCVIFFAAAVSAQGGGFEGKVVEVVAADLLKIEREGAPYEVRIYGVDAPEPGQAFSAEAAKFVKEKTAGQVVKAEGLAVDSLGKMVASVTLPDGTDLGLALASAGLAWWDEVNAPEAKVLKGATVKALVGKLGLFTEAAALAPWDYRKSNGGTAYTYSVKPAEEKPKAVEGPVELKAKGDMTEGSTSNDLVNQLPSGFEIPEQYKGMVAKHNPRIATDANGNAVGLTADGLGENPLSAMLGFQNGDVITGVNGMPLRSMADIENAVSSLKGTKNVKISVTRGGKSIDVPIPIP